MPHKWHSYCYQYQFTYDNLDRILTGNLQKRLATGSSFADYFKLNGMSYDDNGNIKTLNRNFGGIDVDLLAYNYTQGNQLAGVKDNSNNVMYFKDNGSNRL